ncbi:hypothetical protein F0919_03675 [Taibaiella lutea]|uniref:Uncharacterized protein n=1 Tax=Taibaiella lutea TaxID=2608001 RepID=A0A5M6CNJ3_9BACT|nr:hypothetical protein [Taibaiella lutea]KAA5536781.1 hypothetical protein F0919_03675 [Taibaiella lutea]
MLNNVALDVVIGLVFIFLLYSLFATVVSEIIATALGLRARNLMESVGQMLEDEKDRSKLEKVIDSLRLMKKPDGDFVKKFYQLPEIKKLKNTGFSSLPSVMRSGSFSRAIYQKLFGAGFIDKDSIEAKIMEGGDILSPETKIYVLNLWKDSYGDIEKFKASLEHWFDRTMEQCTEWYKRKIQVVLLILGFVMAWCFNADTIGIIHKLSTDKKAREEMVTMATAYIQNNKNIPITPTNGCDSCDSVSVKSFNQKLDSLLKIKSQLDKDIAKANSLLGSGSWLPDSVMVLKDSATGKRLYIPELDATAALKISKLSNATVNKYYVFSSCDKWHYLFSMFCVHFMGFLITAIAISLGAPFWFDMLNKLIQLRTSVKPDNSNDDNANANNNVSSPKREA